ncbi:hypothetical protein CEXT_282091 [Caerostris extrusa]|uniref:Uncharacterized protein n=1 Tax=Caerostris extrusa TaxID=172846 RepID=A0AAV4MVD7_CAEEX|nr:hypothetical protein CEXT_282091 [Caerostris extrusa]
MPGINFRNISITQKQINTLSPSWPVAVNVSEGVISKMLHLIADENHWLHQRQDAFRQGTPFLFRINLELSFTIHHYCCHRNNSKESPLKYRSTESTFNVGHHFITPSPRTLLLSEPKEQFPNKLPQYQYYSKQISTLSPLWPVAVNMSEGVIPKMLQLIADENHWLHHAKTHLGKGHRSCFE